MKHYRIELLQTAEGINLRKDKTEDIIVVLLWSLDIKKARESAKKIADALLISTHVGNLEYIVKSIRLYK
ncbi:MAG: hypothetical protein Q7S73_00235 [bacterium]|nr:hypothetical protein [bacterium]